jgi:hypothetical protein
LFNQELDIMNFPQALTKILKGYRVTNVNWNGKNMYVFMMSGYPFGVYANKTLSEGAGIKEGSEVIISPYLMMYNAKGEFVPWLISNMDVFSEGWKVVD